jgi:hypothetical protein
LRSLLACLRISPHSLEELSHGLMLRVRRIALIVNKLVAAGAIRQLETDREGGPFYALPGYVEASGRRDHSDVTLGRDYGGQYEAPIWRDEI